MNSGCILRTVERKSLFGIILFGAVLVGCRTETVQVVVTPTPEPPATVAPRLSAAAAGQTVDGHTTLMTVCELVLAPPLPRVCSVGLAMRGYCNLGSNGQPGALFSPQSVSARFDATWDGAMKRWEVRPTCDPRPNGNFPPARGSSGEWIIWLYDDTREVVPANRFTQAVFGLR
jgi:hypothetical protein